MTDNIIHTGDCLTVLRSFPDECVDLIYLDPPYNTGKDWEGASGSFADRFASRDDYIAYMRDRLIELRRVLKQTGSIYLHTDWRVSHYLKVAMDTIFGDDNFRNDISWCYTGAANVSSHFPRKHDSILFYAKSAAAKFNKDAVRGIPYKSIITTKDSRIFKRGHNHKRVAELLEMGKVPESYWIDIKAIQGFAGMNETANYPTQKPIALLTRIIKASSNEGDIVLDPFCGSGTTLCAARELNRRYVGIDISEDAKRVCEKRLATYKRRLL